MRQIVPDVNETAWPGPIRVGAGAHAMTLLNNVPIIYEVWRQINGFPPNFYDDAKSKSVDKKEESYEKK